MVQRFAWFMAFALAASPAWAMGKDDPPLRILALGDSTTAGTPGYASPVEMPPSGAGNPESQYAFWVQKKHRGWTIDNKGVAGERSDEILGRFEAEPAGGWDLVVVLAGVNDLYQGYDTAHVRKNLTKIYDLALKRQMKVVACTILPYNVSTPEVKSRMDELNRWIRENAAGRGFLFCDTYDQLNDPARPGNLADTPDGLHPSVRGYRRMGEAIEKVISEGSALA